QYTCIAVRGERCVRRSPCRPWRGGRRDAGVAGVHWEAWAGRVPIRAKQERMFSMQIGDGLRERVRWSGCGVLAGLVIGVVLGWMFHGLIGTIFRIGIILLFILPFVAAFAFWLWS